MKKTAERINLDTMQGLDTFTHILDDGSKKVLENEEWQVADALFTMGKNFSHTDSVVHSQAFWMGMDALVDNNQVGVLEKINQNFQDDKPKFRMTVPNSLMFFNVQKEGQTYFKTMPQWIGKIVFGSEEKRQEAYMRRFVKDRLDTCKTKASAFAENGNMVDAQPRASQPEVIPPNVAYNMEKNAILAAAINTTLDFKKRTNSNRMIF